MFVNKLAILICEIIRIEEIEKVLSISRQKLQLKFELAR